jgi:hypothetical protein
MFGCGFRSLQPLIRRITTIGQSVPEHDGRRWPTVVTSPTGIRARRRHAAAAHRCFRSGQGLCDIVFDQSIDIEPAGKQGSHCRATQPLILHPGTVAGLHDSWTGELIRIFYLSSAHPVSEKLTISVAS